MQQLIVEHMIHSVFSQVRTEAEDTIDHQEHDTKDEINIWFVGLLSKTIHRVS